MEVAVQQLFEEYFAESFAKSSTPGSIDKASLSALINEKFQGDEHLTEVLNNEIEKVESPEAGENQTISEDTVMRALGIIMKNQIKLNNAEIEENQDLLEEY